jgi:hypothetical protein
VETFYNLTIPHAQSEALLLTLQYSQTRQTCVEF